MTRRHVTRSNVLEQLQIVKIRLTTKRRIVTKFEMTEFEIIFELNLIIYEYTERPISYFIISNL